ncbi:cyclic nucleotide-binding domain protein [Cystobacter fuscus DSM 2262]|uniref:Cyclic nucleotide-binding domain protein n=1 Tax=Cystobacter fuscus (strain ATCC 25194 / DSM 2262 / NBRC 100088 / M29) TaxID=1242864 RepID=S9PBI1_CYSF2|nr:cyclic nucleotide-binding domain-containing protein [Cystobacter fuscus]EPX61775.1 cyclic nucleotide-binding domain protein [Cystobacter fuscus DSM 2262]
MVETLREHKDNAAQLFASGQWEAALVEYRHITRAAPEDLASRQKVAELLQRLGRKQEAIETYTDVAKAWARQGWLLRAIALCKLILHLEPGHGPTQRLLADFHAGHARPQPRLTPAPVVSATFQESHEEGEEVLPRIPLFSKLSPEAFLAVVEELKLKPFEPGATLITEGEAGQSLFAIVEGRVDVVRQGDGGQNRKVACLGEGDFFGEMALLSDAPRLASVVAATRTVVFELTREQVERLAELHPSVAHMLRSFYQVRLLANILRGNPLLFSLTPLQREAMTKAVQFHAVSAGQSLLVQGQPGDALYLLLRGQCRVVHRLPDGHENEHPSLHEGDMFGELSVLLGLPATASVIADTPCTLLRLARADVERLIVMNTGLREALFRLSSERLQRTAQLVSSYELDGA